MQYDARIVEIGQLVDNPQNPKERSVADKQLAASIEEIGLHYPLIVAREGVKDGKELFMIVDGHRRKAALVSRNHTHVPVLITDSKKEKVYSHLSANSRKLNSADWLEMAVNNPEAQLPGGQTSSNIKAIRLLLGEESLKYMADNKIRPSNFGIAVRVNRLLGWTSPTRDKRGKFDPEQDLEPIKKTLRWILKHKQGAVVTKYLSYQNSQHAIDKIQPAIESDRPVLN